MKLFIISKRLYLCLEESTHLKSLNAFDIQNFFSYTGKTASGMCHRIQLPVISKMQEAVFGLKRTFTEAEKLLYVPKFCTPYCGTIKRPIPQFSIGVEHMTTNSLKMEFC